MIRLSGAERTKRYRERHPSRVHAGLRRWYQNNKDYHRIKREQRRNERLELLQSIKETTPCSDCGRNYPHYVMEFDHILPPRKSRDGRRISLSNLCSARSQALQEELAKCEIVCANCHCVRTWERKQQA